MDFFQRLKLSCTADWERYTHHAFVEQLGSGCLPKTAFQHYLIQDYLFLIQFARAWSLAAYKSRNLKDIKRCQEVLGHILTETDLHVRLCAKWGISENQLAAEKERTATIAYTRFVLDTGASGDLLDLMVSLAPCVIGYAEIGCRLAPDGAAQLDRHPYKDWISQYAHDSYQQVAKSAKVQLNELAQKYLTEARFDEVAAIFAKATQLEADFWQMSLDQNPL